MSLWGAENEKKPVWLTEEEKKNCYATERGWVLKHANGIEEVLVAIPNLNERTGKASLTAINIVAKKPTTNNKITATMLFNEEVTLGEFKLGLTIGDAESAPEAWQATHEYQVDDKVSNGGQNYKCLIQHTSPSVFNVKEQCAAWQATHEYNIGDKVSNGGQNYNCLVHHTSEQSFGLKETAPAAYSSESTYEVGDKVTQDGKYYTCKTAVEAPEEFQSEKWTAYELATYWETYTPQTYWETYELAPAKSVEMTKVKGDGTSQVVYEYVIQEADSGKVLINEPSNAAFDLNGFDFSKYPDEQEEFPLDTGITLNS